ncbi:MAG: response regulator transcription factor [Wenzhouxiangella sp.]
MRTICIIEDEPVQRLQLESLISIDGYAVISFESSDAFLSSASIDEVDLLLLDWHLPGQSGLELTWHLRLTAQNWIPVIFITAHNDEQRLVEALDAGADDYLVKPVQRAELLARVRAALRRSGSSATDLSRYPPFGLDKQRREVLLNTRRVKATPKEFELLAFLFLRQGQACSRQTLLAHVWKTQVEIPTRTIDTHISRLKKKFQLDGRHGWLLEGLYQQGYRLVSIPPCSKEGWVEQAP